MIVKDESHVIKRCLSSLKSLLSYWVIVDTGSTDGTQEIIRQCLSDIPGELHERPWVNFGHNRSEALNLARGKSDYILFIDADDRLVFREGFRLPVLTKDHYYVIQEAKDPGSGRVMKNYHVLLIKDLPEFRWEGAVHETLVRSPSMSYEILDGVINEYLHDGSRSRDPDKFLKDIQMLKAAYEKDPQNGRHVFYLAQTYRGVDLQKALYWFEKRAKMGGEENEVFYSLYMIGVIRKSPKALAEAYLFRPTRAEPLFTMAEHYLSLGNHWFAFLIASFAKKISLPANELFVESWIYESGLQKLLETACLRERQSA